MTTLTTTIQTYRRTLDKLLADYRHAGRCVVEEKQALAEAREQAAATLEAQQVVQAIAQQIQQQVHGQIASLVTKCLQTIFDDPYEFQIRFDRKRGKTEAQLLLLRDGMVLEDPPNEAGGGVVDLAAFALRLSCLLLTRPPLRRVLFLDEPMKFINGAENQAKVGDLLLSLARELQVQMVIVSDDDWLKIGKVINLGGTER